MRSLLVISCVFIVGALWATPSITGVTAQQRYPWNGKVDISYTVSGDIAAYCGDDCKTYGLIPSLKVTATDKVASTNYTATSLSGDTALTDGTHSIVWDLDAQGLSIKSTNVVFNVSCEMAEATYCVIDLSGGSSATSYPVTYLAEEPGGGFNVDAYKTTKLVLKRLNSGTFIMGEDQTNEAHRVTLTKPFYMGLFEVTQKQWSLVMGANPAKEYGVGDTYPVYYVSYDMIRGSSAGACWPASSAVDSVSFLGKLQSKTGLNFDLPTEAQWEYACRAGTTTTYYWGDSMDGNYAWYASNSDSQTHPVGGKTANAWGLYDMCGNVWERCLDWYNSTLSYGTDPKGSSSGANRVQRGGSWSIIGSNCTSSYRFNYTPSLAYSDLGFRLSRTLPDEQQYCIIDVSSGADAEHYPVTYMAYEPVDGFNTDEYKTGKIVLKKMETGSFKMQGTGETTLTKPFYMGLFEVTQKQWSLVMGSNPSKGYGVGDTYPVYYVSYDMIRGSSAGAGWPVSSAVDSTSFLGKLQSKTGLNFDLPTEAQWEYACRAGTTTTYYWGNSMNGNYAWYTSNSSSKTHPVGGKTANAWGLYDMCGNVWEWCLDWYNSTLSYGTDPKGSSSGSCRVGRGGGWSNNEWSCTSSNFGNFPPSGTYNYFGFRLSRTLP